MDVPAGASGDRAREAPGDHAVGDLTRVFVDPDDRPAAGATLLTGGAAAVGIALINTFGNVAGFAAGYVTGFLKDLTGSYVVPMFAVGGLMALSGILMVALSRWGRIERTGPEAESDPGTEITASGPVR